MSTPTIDDVRESGDYKAICQVMDVVFGHTWSIDEVFPGDHGLDFVMRITVNGIPGAAYLNVANTLLKGETEPTLGSIGASVPYSAPRCWHGPDGVHLMGIQQMIGSYAERRTYRFGADSQIAGHLEGYLRLLKQYFDQPPQAHIDQEVHPIIFD